MTNKLLIVFVSCIGMMLFSCGGDRVFEEYHGMESKSWLITDTVSFYLSPTKYNTTALVSIKYNSDYAYRNLYVKYILTDTLNNNIESQLVNIRLFDGQSGKPTGKGYGSTYTRMDTLPLQINNNYSKVQFIQYMRVDKLEGIEAIGFRQNKIHNDSSN
ncbi:gliding motility lipoprotein GldH [Belliella sp. DSM 111904]|uniref:Gliding motility lipoprotein GldH n=1 Tax=Belliella filtrata TaxID=2923435 RepID=A0ABS9V0Z7_9BACT|nr:gliding motility lipoprotein GldH [Belliella filtrata]MCH7410087.1 gliding motility lipoprotein GldH [Belliella filtrata]